MNTKTVIFIIFIYSGSSKKVKKEANHSCISNDDCKPKIQGGNAICSICADSNFGESKCLHPFPYMFSTGNSECDKLDPCPINCPAGKGRCVQKDEYSVQCTPACECLYPFYGSECQYKAAANQKPISYVSWAFKGVIPVYEPIELKCMFLTPWGRDFRTTKLKLYTDDGYYKIRSRWSEDLGGCYFDSKTCTVLPIKIKFPYKLFSRTSTTQFITLKNQVVGYFANFTIVAIDFGNIIYNRQFQIVVSYEEKVLKCVPDIKIKNCSPSSQEPTVFTRLTGIDLKSDLLYVTDGGYIDTSVIDEKCSNDNLIAWKLWSITETKETSQPLFVKYMNHVWHFNPYTLKIGVYKILFEVQNVRSLASNFAFCYVKVRSLPLILQVEGGSDRMVNKNSGLKLSAARSTDPNMPPSQQQDLYVELSCKIIEPPTKYDPVCKPKTMNVHRTYIIPSKLLSYSTVYNFTLKLWSTLYSDIDCDDCDAKPKYTSILIRVSDKSNKSISIQCVENCNDKVIPNKPFFLKVICENVNMTSKTDFSWTYSIGSGVETPLDSIKVGGVPPFMMLIKENSLKSGTEYTITVRDISEKTYAKYRFITDSLSYDGVCKVKPMEGTRGLTEFNIICPLQNETVLVYEFYDNSFEDIATNQSLGRMLGTASNGQLQNVMLSRGCVTVLIINPQGLSLRQEIRVQLSDSNNTGDILLSLKNKLRHALNNFDNEDEVLRYTSIIADILPIGPNKDNEFNFVLSSLSSISLNRYENIEIVSSILSSILKSWNQNVQMKLRTIYVIDAVDFTIILTNSLRKSALKKEITQYVPPKIIENITENILKFFIMVLKCKSDKTENVEHNAVDLQLRTSLKHGLRAQEKIIDNLKDILTLIQYPGKPPIRISTSNEKVILWAIKNDIDYPITHILGNNNDIPVGIPGELMYLLENTTHNPLSLQIAYLGDTNLIWYKSDIKSEMVSLSLAVEGDRDLTYIRTLRHPLTIRMNMDDNLVNMELNGSITQADSSLDQDYLDIQVKIHRLDIKPRSYMTIVFLYPPTNGSLRVSVMEEYRPDFKHMIEHSMIISKESPQYPHHYHDYEEPRFLYMGIIPGKEVSVNQSIRYSFEVNTTLCQYWSRGFWKSDGCLVSPQTQGKNVICQCTHLSTFGTSFLVPPQQVDPFGDAKLFLTVLDNPLVVSIVITFLVIYFLLCLWLRPIDKNDEMKKSVIVLEDNFPFDKFPYLLAVFTSPRLNAGTTAHVGVKLVGSEAESRAHILTNSKSKVLKTGNDDWFLIYCPKHLGKIVYVHLWHDNAGWGARWLIDGIFLYDLTNNTETKFIVHEWLAVDYTSKRNDLSFPEAKVLPSKSEDISTVKKQLLSNIVLGIRDDHKIISVFYRHPRSRVTRVQRLSIIIVFVMVTMLNSIMYYKPADETTIGIDDYNYSIQIKEFIISIQSLILSTLLTVTVLFAFKRSSMIKLRNIDRRSTISNKYGRDKRKRHSTLIRRLTSTLMYSTLDPVQLKNPTHEVEKRWFWLIFAWVSCTTIVSVCSYLTMLYGLKLGPVKSQKWLTSVLLALVEDSLIFGPAKIILVAVVYSLTFQLMIDINTYQFDIEDLQERCVLQKKDIDSIHNNRKQKMYAPLSNEARNKIVKERQIWLEWCTFLDFLVATVFLLVLCNIIYKVWPSHYHTNSHIIYILTNTKYSLLQSITFKKVTNISQLEQYLSNTFINIVYNAKHYENKRIQKGISMNYEHLNLDLTNSLVGLPKIRQLRTEFVPCNNIFMPNVQCIPEWKESCEDTNMYSKGWNPATYSDVQKDDSYWIYKDKSSSFKPALLRLYGPSGRFFHDGGYSVTLGPTRLEAEQTLDALQIDRWQDEKTRVVFVELTAFNGNKILLSQATLVVEYLVSGSVLLKAQGTTVSSVFHANVWIFLFVVFIIAYILKTIYLINYFGLLEYLFSGFEHLFHIFTIVFGILAIVLFCSHFFTALEYIEQFHKSEIEEYFEFDSFALDYVWLRISLFLLLCVSIVLFIGAIRGGKSLLILFHVTISPIRHVYFVVAFILLFSVLRHWALPLVYTLFTLKELLINSRSLKFVMVQHLQYNYVKVFIIFKIIFIFTLSAMFLMILINRFRLSKSQILSVSQSFNFATFIASRVSKK